MAFRADEAERVGLDRATDYLITRLMGVEPPEKERSLEKLLEILEELGPVVDSYPSWHPLVCNQKAGPLTWPITTPSRECGYKGIDHPQFFANGFIACPYGDGQDLIDSVEALSSHPVANITAERLDVKFYNTEAVSILVKCEWARPLSNSGMIPAALAIPLILEQELPCWRYSDLAETWESMRPYFLGRPHGARSSLFIDQECGLVIKKIWNALINTGMYGPIKV